MKNNVFIKSMLRQPIQTTLLVLLIALAAGAFVMRAAEFRVISGTLSELRGRYEAFGFIRTGTRRGSFEDVSDAQRVISYSEYIEFEDIRRGVEGVMHGVLNEDILGWRSTGGSRAPHVFFYGEVVDITVINEVTSRFTVKVDYVTAGYPEHVVAGQYAEIRHHITAAMLAGADGEVENPINDLQVGRRYFFRARLHYQDRIPTIGNENNVLNLQPLNSATFSRERGYFSRDEIYPDEPLWFIPVGTDERVDYNAPGFEWLADEIEWLHHTHRGLNLRATYEMISMPAMWQGVEAIRLMDGRLIDREDYYAENHVVVIPYNLARIRGLEIGDTLTVSIPREQVVFSMGVYQTQDNQMINQPFLGSAPGEFVQTLELEIVGIWAAWWGTSRQMGADFTLAYIPESILTRDYDLHPGWSGLYGLPDVWYSFKLNDPLDRSAFLARYEAALLEMGFVLTVPYTGAENFHATAAPVMQTLVFNFVVFGVVSVLTLALVCWLFLRQRRKDFAIARALGGSAGKSFRGLAVALAVFGLPAVTVGGVAAWFIALRQATATLNPFEEIVCGFEPYAALDIYFLPIFIAAAFLGLLVIFAVFAARMSRRPVLELLQK